MPLLDRLGRPLRNLRLSVTDRCNLRCQYCMPEDEYTWLPREDVLHFEEISRLVDIFLSLGVDRLRLTGGEPLLRRDLASLVGMVSAKTGLADLALTTNGILLADQIDALKATEAKVKRKFQKPFVSTTTPTNADAMEEEWQRFLNA